MGPIGTQDLFMLTDGAFMLPLTAIGAWSFEMETLSLGVLPKSFTQRDPTSWEYIKDVQSLDPQIVGEPQIFERKSFYDVSVVFLLIAFYGFARTVQPWATAHCLFDRGSPVHN